MRTITSRSGQLQWTQPHLFRREYELRSGPELMATLKLHGMFGSLATAESADGTWTFKRLGWCGGRATIRAVGQSTNLAEFRKTGWAGSGELTFAGGRTFRLTPNFWTTRFEIGTETDQPLVRIRRTGFVRKGGEVEIAGGEIPELPLLVLFGWYLFTLQLDDSGGAAGVAAAG